MSKLNSYDFCIAGFSLALTLVLSAPASLLAMETPVKEFRVLDVELLWPQKVRVVAENPEVGVIDNVRRFSGLPTSDLIYINEFRPGDRLNAYWSGSSGIDEFVGSDFTMTLSGQSDFVLPPIEKDQALTVKAAVDATIYSHRYDLGVTWDKGRFTPPTESWRIPEIKLSGTAEYVLNANASTNMYQVAEPPTYDLTIQNGNGAVPEPSSMAIWSILVGTSLAIARKSKLK